MVVNMPDYLLILMIIGFSSFMLFVPALLMVDESNPVTYLSLFIPIIPLLILKLVGIPQKNEA